MKFLTLLNGEMEIVAQRPLKVGLALSENFIEPMLQDISDCLEEAGLQFEVCITEDV